MSVSLITASMLIGFSLSQEDREQTECLVEAIYYEARGSSLQDQVGVGNVILNRVRDSSHPSSVCGVINKKHQFSYKWDNIPELPAMRSADKRALHDIVAIAALLYKGHITDNTYYSTHYINVEKMKQKGKLLPKWFVEADKRAVIGKHTYVYAK